MSRRTRGEKMEMGGEGRGGGGGMGDDGKGMMGPHLPSGMPGGCDMSHMHGDGMKMHMTFFWGSHVQVLFSGWPGDRGLGMYLLALLAVLVSSALLESLSSLSSHLSRPSTAAGRRISTGLLLTVIHAARMGLAYLVMLAVMSFNVGVLIAAVAGHAFGFLFSRSGIFSRGSQSNNQDGLPSADGLPSTNGLPSTKY